MPYFEADDVDLLDYLQWEENVYIEDAMPKFNKGEIAIGGEKA